MGWLFAAVLAVLAVLFTSGLTMVSGRESDIETRERDRVYRIREERLMTANAASAPDEIPAPEDRPVSPWAKYDVPLDDDLQKYIAKVCKEYEIEPCVVMAVIKTESGCDPLLVGDGGRSYGLMQILASEHTSRCIRLNAVNLLDPYQNVLVGIDYLAELRDIGHGMEWALSWYNGHGGEPCDYSYTVLTEAERLLESVQVMEG